VHDHVADIDQDPRAVGIPFDASDVVTVLANRFDDPIRDRAGLNFRAPGYDREGVGKDRSAADVERDEGLPFLVEGAIAYEVY
jgi:hypothetical protein